MTPVHKAKWCIAVATLAVCVTGGLAAIAQQSLGSVKTDGAEVAGMVTVSGGRAVIANSGSITATAGTAEVSLTRGGSVKVCTGSSARLSQPMFDVTHPPLLMALNRGSMEIQTRAEKNDVILTPDLRFEVSDPAPLNVRVRLVANGDTCVDNSGKDAPMLHATEAFGTGAYFIRPGQRVLFEHGSLREVVDHETSSCGCPKPDALVLAGKGRHGDGKIPEAGRINPFPEAVSQGLAAPAPPQQAAPVGEVQTQVSSTLAYDGKTNAASGPPGEVTTAASLAPAAKAATPSAASASAGSSATASSATGGPVATDAHVTEAAPPPAGPNPFRAIGRFFRRLFGSR
jgi:hypothetical protein